MFLLLCFAVGSARVRWDRMHRQGRKWLSRHTPVRLIEYPFETFSAFASLLIGVPIFLDFANPGSLMRLLPDWALFVYGIALLLGSATLACGLVRRQPLVMASGLQLLGGVWVVYALALTLSTNLQSAWAAFILFLGFGIVSLLRATHFRRVLDIQIGARKREGDE